MDDEAPTKSIPYLLVELVLELGWIALTLLTPVFAPLAFGLLGWLAYLPVAWLVNRVRGGVPYRLQQLNFFWSIGLGIGVARAIPPFWLAFCVGALVAIGGLLLVSHLEKRLGLNLEKQKGTKEEPAVMEMPVAYEARGASAWGGGEPKLTPEGDPIRLLGESEIAMGGPVVSDYLLPDGSVIFNASPSAQFSSDGRHFVSPAPSRSEWGLLIYDRQERLLYYCSISHFWELDTVTDTEVIGRVSPLTSDATYRAQLSELKASARTVEKMVAVKDLWITEGYWQHLNDDHSSRTLPSPPGAPALALRAWLPDSLQALGDPLQPLRHPMGELWLDGEATGLMLMQPDPHIVFSDDAQTFVCAASRDEVSGFWLWQRGSGWRLMGNDWQAKSREPHSTSPNFVGLEKHHLRLRMSWGQPRLDYERYGALSSFSYSEQALVISHDDTGEAQMGWAEMADVDVLLPFGDQPLLLQSAPLENGQRMTFEALRDSTSGDLRAYHCHIDQWQVPGEWVLDHRVSECGQFIALIAFADAPAVLHRVAIVEPRSESVHWLEGDIHDVHLQGFINGQLHLLRLLGRNRYKPPNGPGEGDFGMLRRCDQRVPTPGIAHDFSQARDNWRLYYEQQHAATVAGRWQLIPTTRQANQPPVANADGNFMLPNAQGSDTAWGFGFGTDNSYELEKPKAPRQGGYLLTASGIGVGGLAPSMVWSADGRYLALTRRVNRFAEDALEHDVWRLLLVDTHEKTLRTFPEDLGWAAQFTGFDETLLFTSQASEQRTRRSRHTHLLATLLQAPAAPLKKTGQRWLPKDQWAQRDYWRDLDWPG